MMADSSKRLVHMLAYHRLLIGGTFSKPVAIAVGLLLALGTALIAGGIYKLKPGAAHGGAAMVLVALGMMAVCILTTAARVSSQSLQRMTPNVGPAAFSYLYGLWWLMVSLGVGLALVMGLPPVLGLLAGVLYAGLGNTFGGSAYSQVGVGLALMLTFKLERDYNFLTGLSTVWQFVVLAAMLVAAAWHARAAVEGTLNAVQAQLGMGGMSSVSYSAGKFAAIVAAASKPRQLSLGLGPMFDSLHWSVAMVVVAAAAAIAWLGPFSGQEYLSFMGAGCGLLVVFYLAMIWRFYLAAGACRDVLILAPTLPTASAWNGALGRIVMGRAALVGMVGVFCVAACGFARFGCIGGWVWWSITTGAAILASLGAWANYHGTLRVRTAILGILGTVAFTLQSILFIVVNPFTNP